MSPNVTASNIYSMHFGLNGFVCHVNVLLLHSVVPAGGLEGSSSLPTAFSCSLTVSVPIWGFVRWILSLLGFSLLHGLEFGALVLFSLCIVVRGETPLEGSLLLPTTLLHFSPF